MSIYFISVGNKLFSTSLSKSKNTCLIALTDRNKAHKLRTHIVESQLPVQDVNFFEHITVETMNYNSSEFTTMMKVNNFSLLLAHDFTIDQISHEYEFHGDTLNFDYDIDSQTIRYLDQLYNKN